MGKTYCTYKIKSKKLLSYHLTVIINLRGHRQTIFLKNGIGPLGGGIWTSSNPLNFIFGTKIEISNILLSIFKEELVAVNFLVLRSARRSYGRLRPQPKTQ